MAQTHLNGITINSGSDIKKIDSGTVSVDPPSVAATSSGTLDITITGVAVGDLVFLEPPAGLADDLLIKRWTVKQADTVTIEFYNPTGAAIDDAAKTWRYLWFDLT